MRFIIQTKTVAKVAESAWLIAIAFLFTSPFCLAQDFEIEDDANPESELCAAINPADTNNIVVAVMNMPLDSSQYFSNTNVYYTTDFGATWHIGSFQPMSGNTGAGDPVICFNRSGTAYLGDLAACLWRAPVLSFRIGG